MKKILMLALPVLLCSISAYADSYKIVVMQGNKLMSQSEIFTKCSPKCDVNLDANNIESNAKLDKPLATTYVNMNDMSYTSSVVRTNDQTKFLTSSIESGEAISIQSEDPAGIQLQYNASILDKILSVKTAHGSVSVPEISQYSYNGRGAVVTTAEVEVADNYKLLITRTKR